MIGNKYSRLDDSVPRFCNIKKYRILSKMIYWLLLRDRYEWKRLTPRQRRMARKYGAIARYSMYYDEEPCCPEFMTEIGLRLWLKWLLEQKDLDSDLRKAILENMEGGEYDRV